jgi:hypothetical protein
MGSFTIRARVHSAGGGGRFTATVSAVPLERSALADVRTHECESRLEAVALLDHLAQRLESELANRGDRVVSIEGPYDAS